MMHARDNLSTVGVILSTVGDTQYCGDIMMLLGDIMSTLGENFLLFEYPYGTIDILPHVS